MELRQELIEIIRQEEQVILASFPLERRLAVMEISRAMDSFWVSINNSTEPLDDSHPVAQFIMFGLNKALSLFMDESCKYPSFPLMRSTDELQRWADSVLQHCGRLGICEHLLEICRIGLAELRRDQPRQYRFSFDAESIGAEAYEATNFAWFKNYVSNQQEAQMKILKSKRAKIWKMMSKKVRPWNKHFIQYDTNPEIDSYYEMDGILYAQLMYGQDSFPGDAKFGGKEFNLYRAAVGVLTGWSFKHLGFCAQLVKKHPELDWRNITTIPQHFDVVAEELATALEVDLESAKQAMEAIMLTVENKRIHCSVAGNFVAPIFIEAGQGRIICPTWGALSHPFQFMLDELKRRYRSDWDRAVDSREQVFREELYLLFPQSRFIRIHRSINVKVRGSVLTDIDAMVLDRETGLVALFQLKWQDFFRKSMRKRESQKKNILYSGNQWVERISNWLSCNDCLSIGRVLGFNRGDTEKIKGFRLFVIGRNSAHFSGPGKPDDRAAWGIWFQLLRFIEDMTDPSDPINHLFLKLIDDSPLKKENPQVASEEFEIGSAKIILDPIGQ